MYTGIVQGIAEVVELRKANGLANITLSFPDRLIDKLAIGASVALDGVCLTVVNINKNNISFDAMKETLNKTTLGELFIGSTVNIERSARQGDEIGGHILSGHVEGMSEIVYIESEENNLIITFRIPDAWRDYVLHKGFIGINGCSLTIVKNNNNNEFSVFFIPETLRATTFSKKNVGDLVNIELDYQTKVIVNTVKNYLDAQNLSTLINKEK